MIISTTMSTPVRQQYLDIKKQYPSTILFFRLGDFYETFDDDARVVSSELDIALTAREIRGHKVPLAGVPYHAAEGYIARLVSRGHKVAVCEQLTEPNGREMIERKVVRIVTPGTVDDPAALDARRNNYVATLVLSSQGAGIAYSDITTGELAATQLNGMDFANRAREELTRLAPTEIVVAEGPSSAEASPEWKVLHTSDPFDAHITTTDGWRWKAARAKEAILNHTGATSLEAFGLDGSPLAVRAVGGLLQYIEETHPTALANLRLIRSYCLSEYMPLDDRTRRNLELVESNRGDRSLTLLGVLDRTCTPMGGRLLRTWVTQPLLDRQAIESRLDNVEALALNTMLRTHFREDMQGVADLERLTNRAVQNNITPRELRALGDTLMCIPAIKRGLSELPSFRGSRVQPAPDLIDLLLTALVDDPPASINAGHVVREGYSQELDRLRSASTKARKWIAALERSERERTGIKGLKVGYNKVFGYYIEVSNASKNLVPDDFIRKQTLVGAERYITPQLKEYESLILNSQSQSEELEASLYQQIVGQVSSSARSLSETAAAIAELDCLVSLGEVAVRNEYTRPELNDGCRTEIQGGRHPVVEQRTAEGFTRNDCTLDAEREQILLVTGPNMAGKSTYLRQVALITLMAQIGSFVPASSARIGIVDRIFTRVGAQDDIASGQSTFMVEMSETAYILSHCTQRSLVILDEIGRGTSTYDGLAIAQAVVEYLHNNPKACARTLFATHYHELNALAGILPRIRNCRMDVLEEGDDVVFLRRVVEGSADRSYGVHVARLAGLPRSVVRRAQELLHDLESGKHVSRQLITEPEPQLTFLNPDDGLLRELAKLDVESLTPIEALTELYEIKKRAAQKMAVE